MASQFAFQKSFPERTHFISEHYTVEVIIFVLDDSGCITFINLIMIFPVLIIICDPDMRFAVYLLPAGLEC